MQATVRMALVNQFKDRLEEGSVVTLERYNFGEIQPKYHRVNKALRLSFLSNTKVKPCTDFNGSLYGFDFRRYKSITDLQQEEDGQFDVIGHVVAGEDLNNYDKNEKCGKKKPLTLVDDEEDVEKSKNTTSRISTASKNSTKESFVTKIPLRNIAELLDVGQGVTSIIVGTIITIHEEKGWWYIGCRSFHKKPIRSQDMIDLEADMPKKVLLVKMIGGAQSAMSFQALKLRELRFMSIRHVTHTVHHQKTSQYVSY
ncbi:hypothetical protein Tco_1423211 [Tanacetum coccineum]